MEGTSVDQQMESVRVVIRVNTRSTFVSNNQGGLRGLRRHETGEPDTLLEIHCPKVVAS